MALEFHVPVTKIESVNSDVDVRLIPRRISSSPMPSKKSAPLEPANVVLFHLTASPEHGIITAIEERVYDAHVMLM